MAGWPIYTTRFLRHAGAGVLWTYVVPEFTMAVVRCLTVTQSLGHPCAAFITINGANLYYVQLPGDGSRIEGALSVPVYAGEELGLYLSAEGMTASVSGYHFDDPSRSGEDVSQLPTEPGTSRPWSPTDLFD